MEIVVLPGTELSAVTSSHLMGSLGVGGDAEKACSVIETAKKCCFDSLAEGFT